MNIPDGLPILSHGKHYTPSDGACVMEYVSVLAGETFSDHPACTHPVLATAAITVNDRLVDHKRQILIPYIGRLIGTASHVDEEPLLTQQLAAWVAVNVLPVTRGSEPVQEAMSEWLRDPNRDNALEVWQKFYEYKLALPDATYFDRHVTALLCVANTISSRVDPSHGISAAFVDRDFVSGGNELVDYLGALLDYHQELTGHTPRELDTGELRELASVTA